MLTVGLSAYTSKSVAFNNTLEAFTFRNTGYVYPFYIFIEDISNGERVTQFQLLFKRFELYEFVLGSGSCLFKVPFEGLADTCFFLFVIGKLYSGITIFFYCTNLRNNTRTSLNNGAWNIFSISIENGSHSDFFSN